MDTIPSDLKKKTLQIQKKFRSIHLQYEKVLYRQLFRKIYSIKMFFNIIYLK